MIKVHIFHTGQVIVDDAIPHGSKNPLAVTGIFRSSDKKRTLPVSCYLIEHPKGKILIDTGWDSKYITEKPKRFFGLLDSMSTPVVKQGDSVDCKLASLGLAAKDIDCIFFSHMDFDHTSGLRLVADAKRVMAAKEASDDPNRYFFRSGRSNWELAGGSPLSNGTRGG